MALLFCDGMDAYGVVGDLPRKGWQGMAGNPTIPSYFGVSASAGAYGGGAITIPSTDNIAAIGRYGLFTFSEGYTLNVGFMFKQVGLPSGVPGGGGETRAACS